jgi:hypothetical protein
MRSVRAIAVVTLLALPLLPGPIGSRGASAETPPPTENPLAGFRWFAELAGSCWTGRDPGGKVTDRQCYSVQYGRYVRGTVQIQGGSATGKPAYEGEGLFAWDQGQGRMVYFYWASAGHFGQATGHFEGERLVFPPADEGEGKPAVRSLWTRRDERSFTVVREKKEGGVWTPILTVVYERE